MNFKKDVLADNSALLLLAANIMFLLFALLQGTTLADMLPAYMIETIIIGIFAVLKVFIFKNINESPAKKAFVSIIFFFGLASMSAIFFLGLLFLSKPEFFFAVSSPTQAAVKPNEILLKIFTSQIMIFSAAIFFASHFYSILYNFKIDSETQRSMKTIFDTAYARVFPLYFTFCILPFIILPIAYAMDFLAIADLFPALFVFWIFPGIFAIVKIYVDLEAHIKEHSGTNKPTMPKKTTIAGIQTTLKR